MCKKLFCTDIEFVDGDKYIKISGGPFTTSYEEKDKDGMVKVGGGIFNCKKKEVVYKSIKKGLK